MSSETKIKVVIDSLLMGLPVTLDGVEYYLCEDFCLCTKLTKTHSDGKMSIIYSKVDIPIDCFLRMCNNLREEEIISLVSSLTVSKLKMS